mgnify:CR=1 FL=1
MAKIQQEKRLKRRGRRYLTRLSEGTLELLQAPSVGAD